MTDPLRAALDRIANSPRVQDFALSAEQMQGIARDALAAPAAPSKVGELERKRDELNSAYEFSSKDAWCDLARDAISALRAATLKEPSNE